MQNKIPYEEERLPKNALIIWEILLGFSALVLLVCIAIIFTHGAIARIILDVLVFVLWGFFGLVYFPILFHTYRFGLTATHFFVRRGILFQKEHWMERQQIIFVSRFDTPFTPIFHISALLFTASGARLLLPCIGLRRAKEIERALIKERRTEVL